MKKKLFYICFLFFINLVYSQNPLIEFVNNTTFTDEILEGESIDIAFYLDFVINTDVIVNISAIEDTATNNDYSISSNSITIPAGEQYGFFTIQMVDDNDIESNLEYFKYQVTVISDNTFNTSLIGELSIKDNDIPPVVSFSNYGSYSTKYEGDSASQRISLDRKYGSDINIDITSTPGTADLSDFLPVSTTVTIPAGHTYKEFPLNFIDDSLIENDEFFYLNGLVTSNNTVNTSIDVEILIGDNDTAPTLSFEHFYNTEGSSGTKKLIIDRPFNAPINIQIDTAPGTATNADFTPISANVTINPGDKISNPFNIPIENDDIDEITETYTITTTVTSNNTNNIVETTTHFIKDNDGKPNITFDRGHGTSGSEGDLALMSIWLDYEYSEDVTFDIYQSNGTADSSDYIATPTTFTIPAGERYAYFYETPLVLDQLLEGPETMYFTLNVTSGNTDNVSDTLEFTIRDVYNITANADFIEIPLNTTSSINILENDLMYGLPINPSDVSINLIDDYYNLNLNADGTLNITDNFSTTGNYSLNYEICSINDPNQCDTASIRIKVINPLKVTYTQEYVDYNNDGFTNVGDIIYFTFNVYNIGSNQITNIGAYDVSCPVTIQGGQIDSLNTGGENNTTLYAEYILTQNDINLGYYPSGIKNLNNLKFSGNYADNLVLVKPKKLNEVDLNISDGFKLNAFIDANENGLFDNGEINFPFGHFELTINNSDEINYLYNNPFYIYESDPNNSYDFNYVIDESYVPYHSNAISFNDVSVIPSNGIITYHFPIVPLIEYTDLSVQFNTSNVPAPGFIYENTIVYTNNSTLSSNPGTISFLKDEALDIINVSESDVVLNDTGFTFDFLDLQPLESRSILVQMQVPTLPTVQLGDLTESSVNINTSNTDVVLNNNSDILIKSIQGAYDPNDITERHGEEILYSSFSEEDYLIYTIRFENIGTGNAINVKVKNVLDELLDENTIKMISSSHDYMLKRVGKNLEWNFYGINLPPSLDDDSETGKGYLTFKIKPYSNYAVGDVIPISAKIYFDFNPPIITNLWSTAFVDLTSVNSNNILLSPNPVNDLLTIKSDIAISQIEVVSIIGKQILIKDFDSLNATIDLSTLSDGMYLVKVKSNQSDKVIKIIKK
ncbi:DUF7619 domain-containing protein [Olleya aquimaris]|uniref:Putative secreted protein (Por secretion system target) n=1 Tax=Olleya aquimaris TaxID=639310 RepID=A0A327RU15_9FLAO|nr:Calx-beta domain-containing protein [Olleya aquimaris]RAJ17147.1 putative secreted protein (Por secretion system target) [Olleya aquimaris]